MLLFNKTLYFLQRSMWSGLYSLVLSNIHWCYQLVLLVLSIGVDCNSLGHLPLRLGSSSSTVYNWCFWENKVWNHTACRVSLTGPLSHFGAVDRIPGHLVISSWDIMTQFGHVGSAELHDLHSTTRCGNMLNSSVCLLSC